MFSRIMETSEEMENKRGFRLVLKKRRDKCAEYFTLVSVLDVAMYVWKKYYTDKNMQLSYEKTWILKKLRWNL